MIPVDPALYWEFRARQREHDLAIGAVRTARQRLEAVSRRIETACPGVDFTKTYEWDDATCSLIEVGQDLAPVANE